MVSGPFPRQYDIQLTRHLRERCELREITVDDVKDVIRNGGERPLPGRGVKGGMIFEFTRGNVVVIGEIVANTCFVITTYHEANP